MSFEHHIKDGIIAGLKAQKISPVGYSVWSERTHARGPIPKPGPHKKIPMWASDGTQIRPNQVKDILFLNDKIRDFIETDQRFLFISGEKGLGKTLLLSYKRALMTALHDRDGDGEAERSESGVIFIPDGRPYLDLMTDLPSLSGKHEAFLSEVRNSKRLWAFAIRIAIVSHFQDKLAELLSAKNVPSLRTLDDLCANGKVAPTEVFREILTLNISQLNRTLDVFEVPLERTFRSVRCASLLFIDKVDQGIRNLPKDAWINVQGGLMEASWDCTSTNSHVKIFGTIREEAFTNYESELKGNLQNAVLSLAYNSDDLRQIIDKLSSVYEGVTEFSDFVQMTTVRNNRTGIVEDCFKYMARHTIGRPRDLVILCGKLSESANQISEHTFRKTVNDTAANQVVRNVLREMGMFLHSIKSKDDREHFFRLIPHNIFARDELDLLAEQYSRTNPNSDCSDHPFCDLWTCGFLGVVSEDYMNSGTIIQRFKQPHDPGSGRQGCIPMSDFYLLHPSLHAGIKMLRGNDGYQMFSCIEVGHGCPWHPYYVTLLEIQKEIQKIPAEHKALRETMGAVLPYIHAGMSEQRDCTSCMPASTLQEFQAACEKIESLGLDKLSRHLLVAGLGLKPTATAGKKPKRKPRSPSKTAT